MGGELEPGEGEQFQGSRTQEEIWTVSVILLNPQVT